MILGVGVAVVPQRRGIWLVGSESACRPCRVGVFSNCQSQDLGITLVTAHHQQSHTCDQEPLRYDRGHSRPRYGTGRSPPELLRRLLGTLKRDAAERNAAVTPVLPVSAGAARLAQTVSRVNNGQR